MHYISRALIDLLCEFGTIWIKTDEPFINKQTNRQTHTTYIQHSANYSTMVFRELFFFFLFFSFCKIYLHQSVTISKIKHGDSISQSPVCDTIL